MPENYTCHIAYSGLAASGAVSSAISSVTVGICEVAKVSDFWTRTATVAAGGISGGVTSTMAGGSFLDGLCNGLISSGLNHAMHLVAEGGSPDDPPENSSSSTKQPWDSNGDGKLSKKEADNWWINGNGEPIYVDNSRIDWTGLEIPKGKTAGETFGISTTDAFRKLPLETAKTYGGTSFKIVDQSTVSVIDQLYHYNMRSWNSVENILRNTATLIGKPLFSNGTDYMIHYYNKTINIKP